MKERFKNKKILIIAGAFLLVLVGVTFAYFETSDTFTNIFETGAYSSETEEVFTSPQHWRPGDTTPKTIAVKNNGDKCQNVRVSYTEHWEGANGTIVPNMQNGNSAAIINLANKADWVYYEGDGYYYYNKDLLGGQSTSTFISSVTFNPLIENEYTCTQTGNKRSCESTASYDNADYTLIIKVETIYCDNTEDAWGVDPTNLSNNIAKFDTGRNVNAKMKSLAAGTSKAYSDSDTLITSFVRADTLQTGFVPSADNTISDSTSDYPIYAWYDNGTIYYYTEADELTLNSSAGYFFTRLGSLVNISGASDINATSASIISFMFQYCSSLENLQPISAWNIANATNLSYMFRSCTSLTTLNALASWRINTSSSLDLSGLFIQCTLLNNIQTLSNWDVSSADNLGGLLSGCTSITSLQALSSWDVSNATKLNSFFSGCTGITTLESISGWNINDSESVSMAYMFKGCSNITTLSSISDWDTSSVTTMQSMFQDCTSLTTLAPISDWDTSSVYNMKNMFQGCTGLTSASDINGWDISGVTYTANTSLSNGFYYMFKGCSVHPTFTNRAGTWDSNNSFIPTT